MGGRDRGDDGQAEAGPGAACRGAGPVEAVEDARQLGGGDTGAVVAHLDGDCPVLAGGRGDGAHRAVRRVHTDVGKQVVDGPAQLPATVILQFSRRPPPD
jgi:hypothetical protein